MANEFSYHDVIKNHYPDGVFPKKYDFVTNVETGEEWWVSHIDNNNAPILTLIGNPLNNRTDTYYSANDLPKLTHKPDAFINQTKEFKITYNNNVIHFGREIFFSDSILTGINTSYFKLFKDSVTGVTISVDPTTMMRDIRDYVPAILVTRSDGNYKTPGPMLINQKILPGERVTLVAYDKKNNPITVMPINTANTFVRSKGVDGITGIEILSPYQSASDPSLVDLRERVPTPAVSDFTIKVSYESDYFEVLALNSDKVKISGLEDFLLDTTNDRSRIRAEYTYTPADGVNRYFSRVYNIVKDTSDPVYVEPPVVPVAEIAWVVPSSLGSYVSEPTFHYEDFTEWVYDQPWNNTRLGASNGAYFGSVIVPYGGWEKNTKPAVMRFKIRLGDKFDICFYNKGGDRMHCRHAIVPIIRDPEDPPLGVGEYEQMYLYIFFSHYHKTVYLNDPRNEIGLVSFVGDYYRGGGIYLKETLVLKTWDNEILSDSSFIGKLSSPSLYGLSSGFYKYSVSDFTYERSSIPLRYSQLYKKSYDKVCLERSPLIGSDRVYTSPIGVTGDRPESIPSIFVSNGGTEILLNGLTNLGFIFYGDPGSQTTLKTLYNPYNNSYSGIDAAPRHKTQEVPNADLSTMSFIVSVRAGRMPRSGAGPYVQDTSGPNWYVGIDNWMKFTIDGSGLAYFIDTASGVNESFPVPKYINSGGIYTPDKYFYYEDPYAGMYMNEIVFAYNKTSGKAILIHDGVTIKTWASYPANFPSRHHRAVFNAGTYSGVAAVGIISIHRSSFLSNKLITDGIVYDDYYIQKKKSVLTYGPHDFGIGRSAGYSEGSSYYDIIDANPNMSNSMYYKFADDMFDHWISSYHANSVSIPFSEPLDHLSTKDSNSLYKELNIYYCRADYYFNNLADPYPSVLQLADMIKWTPDLRNSASSGYLWWPDLSRFTQQQIDAAHAYMVSYYLAEYASSPSSPGATYPTTLLTNYGNL